MKSSDYFCILPSGNEDEFLLIDAELKRRNVNANYSILGGGRIYHIPEEEAVKLPHDASGPYLGDVNSGHSIAKSKDTENGIAIECFRKSIKGSAWKRLNWTPIKLCECKQGEIVEWVSENRIGHIIGLTLNSVGEHCLNVRFPKKYSYAAYAIPYDDTVLHLANVRLLNS